MRYTTLSCLIALIAVVFSSGTTALAQSIAVAYSPRPPYYVVDAGGVGGLVAGPAARAFESAKIDVTWRKLPFKRQLKVIEANREPICAVGWFKNPAREKFAKFTDFIYRNRPLMALTRADNAKTLAHKSMQALLADRELRMGHRLGFSYGATVDALIQDAEPVILTTTQDNTGMLRMLVGKRFDYLLMAPEDGEYLIGTLGAVGKDVAMFNLDGIPLGNHRYILCSKQVPDGVIDKLNAAIKQTRE